MSTMWLDLDLDLTDLGSWVTIPSILPSLLGLDRVYDSDHVAVGLAAASHSQPI